MQSYEFRCDRWVTRTTLSWLLVLWAAVLNVGCKSDDATLPCTQSVVKETRSSDSIYLVQLKKSVCQMGAEVSYSIVINAEVRKKGDRAWFTTISIESDSRIEEDPVVVWTGAKSVSVTTKTRTLAGSLTQHIGYDLTLERIYQPSEPHAFPNFY
jgi:hypothetical protein